LTNLQFFSLGRAACDAENNVVTLLLMPSVCGGIPLGVLVTCSMTEAAYANGFRLLQTAFGHSAFADSLCPAVFMMDDSDAERNALRAVWPQSDQKLCLFHVAQALWQWLWYSKHHIDKTD